MTRHLDLAWVKRGKFKASAFAFSLLFLAIGARTAQDRGVSSTVKTKTAETCGARALRPTADQESQAGRSDRPWRRAESVRLRGRRSSHVLGSFWTPITGSLYWSTNERRLGMHQSPN